jgi:hypothetical protein
LQKQEAEKKEDFILSIIYRLQALKYVCNDIKQKNEKINSISQTYEDKRNQIISFVAVFSFIPKPSESKDDVDKSENRIKDNYT